jgi:hypothetical protein
MAMLVWVKSTSCSVFGPVHKNFLTTDIKQYLILLLLLHVKSNKNNLERILLGKVSAV